MPSPQPSPNPGEGETKESLNELGLFAGGGGGLLGSRLLGWKTVCYVENEPYAIEVLKARIRDRMLDDAPIWDDVRTFDGKPWAGLVDVISAGFPCQPWSAAGRHLGEMDERNLWPDTLRIIREVRPSYVLLENSPFLVSKPYIQQIFGDLAGSGFDARWDLIPACAIGAPHFRYRLWIVAHAQEQGKRGLPIFPTRSQEDLDAERRGEILSDTTGRGWKVGKPQHPGDSGTESGVGDTQTDRFERLGEVVPDPDSIRFQVGSIIALDEISQFKGSDWWAVEPGVGRVVDGMAHRVDRIRAIGNGQVPAVVRAVWDWLS